MPGFKADIHGPISRSLWNRLRRRPRYLGATAAAAAVTVLLATEPNLSGIWVDADGLPREIHHVGGSVTANFLDGTLSFTANLASEGTLDGRYNLFWNPITHQNMMAVCAEDGYPKVTEVVDFQATVNDSFDAMDLSYVSARQSEVDCSIQGFVQSSLRLTRRED